MRNTTLNREQELYVMGYKTHTSCLGFEVVKNRAKALATELNEKLNAKNKGTFKMLKEYNRLVDIVRIRNRETGFRSEIELYKPFIGHEGKRVEIVYDWGEKERFYIGKSTGHIPCHLMVKQKNSHGGCSVLHNSIKSFRFV